MKAVLLVGGEGKRMRPVTLQIPKPLLPIANVPFVERQIKWLAKYGIDEVILSLGYMPDAFEAYFHENPIEGVQITYAVENTPLGTAGAIKFAAGDFDENLVVCNGDVLTDLNLASLLEFHQNRNSMATIALTYVVDSSAFGVVPTHADGEVIAFVEKPPLENAPSHWINTGIYVLNESFMDVIPEGINVSIERETFPKVLDSGSMYALESDSYWLDIGTPTQYLRAHSDYLDDKNRFGANDPIFEVAPNLWSDGEVQIGQNVEVVSTSLVGAGSIIGDDCKLNSATLGKRCILGRGVEISNSVLMAGTSVGDSTLIDSSIVSETCVIEEHVVLSGETLVGAHEKIVANSRLQGERVGSVV